ncbi:hypothetical protein NCC78_18250 [Micromonospora phytophila]|uniref:hypothetical protein n=1 Tax=Micromonospora phytophila TaxID=709888 RepID=UPI0020307E54|nr:hypothetical protein [Micromonospora phytophila]MCM0676613.1 hypothetical protein [Micromonospora phytophila]
MERRFSRRRAATSMAALAVLAATVTGCGADDAASTGGGAPAATPAAGGEVVLPIDAYALTTVDVGRLGHARTLLAGDCMRRFGFTFDAQAVEADLRDQVKDVGLHGNLRRYGVTDDAVATRYGYHLASTVEAPAAATGEARSDHGLGQLTAAKEAVLFGTTADGKALAQVGGQQVPRGGCLGEARTRIADAGQLGESAVVSRISAESFQRSLNDPAVTAAIGRWSACMKAQGHSYPSPLEVAATFDLENPTVAAKEVATARADVACKRQVDLVTVWTRFEETYQKSQIEKHAQELQRLKADRAEQLKRVSAVVTGG